MTPKILYKYRTVDKYTLASLVNRSIWFSSPSDFNDPFDCQIEITHIEPTKAEYSEMISKGLRTTAQETGQIIKAEVPPKLFDGDSLSTAACLTIKRFKDTIDRNMSNLGVLSLSEIYDSTTMWGHYADSHKGICIGYKTKDLVPTPEVEKGLLKIDYKPHDEIKVDSFELFARYNTSLSPNKFDQINDQMVSTKTDDWSYEKEWRLIHTSGKGNGCFEDEGLASVYFGLNCSRDDKGTIRNILHDVQMSFFQMIRSSNCLGVEAVLMDRNSKYWDECP